MWKNPSPTTTRDLRRQVKSLCHAMFWPKVLAEVWFGDRALTLQEKQGTQKINGQSIKDFWTLTCFLLKMRGLSPVIEDFRKIRQPKKVFLA